MKERLEELKSDLEWIERMDITINTEDLPGIDGDDNNDKNPVEDDFERELML